MGQQRLLISLWGDDVLRLRSIVVDDIEYLRRWKNLNRKSFYFRQEIGADQQREWYEAFCRRENDYMFVVEEMTGRGRRSIGCMGFRVLAREADIYNVIRGRKSGRPGAIGRAMTTMCGYVRSVHEGPITCEVLIDNPAVNWYISNGFSIREKQDDHYVMEWLPGGETSDAIVVGRF